MKCPYCVRKLRLKVQGQGSRHLYYCSKCETEIHRAYVDFPNTPFSRIGMVGYTGHGKTVYITSLFYQLQALDSFWDSYYFETLDDFTHDIMFEKVLELKKGRLFSGTPINFPEPAFIRFNSLPFFKTQIVSMYDIGGGVFDNLDLMTQKGKYLAHSDTIFFIMSLVEDDIIKDFGPMSTYPDNGNIVISAEGKWLFPSWCDSHTHIVFAAPRHEEFEMLAPSTNKAASRLEPSVAL